MPRKAIIDLGTNTFQLLLIDIQGDNFVILHQEKQAVRIGQGAKPEATFSQEAMQRAKDTLSYFKQIAQEQGIQQLFGLATSAFRNAQNGKAFAQEIEQELGISIDIISGEQEATLIYEGVRKAVDLGQIPHLIMDIGGGSVEFIIANSTQVFWQQSFEIGGWRLIEKFMPTEPIQTTNITELRQFLTEALAPLQTEIDRYKPSVLVGASGAFDTFLAIKQLTLEQKNSLNLNQNTLTINEIQQIYENIVPKNRDERLQIKGMTPLRVDMIVVGAILVRHILQMYPFQLVKVSQYALKEGYLFQQLAR